MSKINLGTSSGKNEHLIASSKSYIGPSIIVFFLYLIFYPLGLVVNIAYLREAEHNELLAGHPLPGESFLSVMLAMNAVLLVLAVVGLITIFWITQLFR